MIGTVIEIRETLYENFTATYAGPPEIRKSVCVSFDFYRSDTKIAHPRISRETIVLPIEVLGADVKVGDAFDCFFERKKS